jgi:hypothetical protein
MNTIEYQVGPPPEAFIPNHFPFNLISSDTLMNLKNLGYDASISSSFFSNTQ